MKWLHAQSYLQFQLNYEDMIIFPAAAIFKSLHVKMAATVITVEFGTSTIILVWRKILKLVCAVLWTDAKINWTLCKLWHFGLEQPCFKQQHEYKWDLFSQNERQVARELNKIWLIEHFKNQLKTKDFFKEIMDFGPQISQQPWHIIYHFKAWSLNINHVITRKWNFATCLSFCGNRSQISIMPTLCMLNKNWWFLFF